jgi:uncharacterized lipoprotein YmbA
VGLGQVRLPAYLSNSSLAVRNGVNEIGYSQSILWAERLDAGIQRVLAANLATLLHTRQIRLSSWRSEDVTVEVYVTVEQFDVDSGGQGVLIARWRILAPGGETMLRAGESRLKRQGPEPEKNPSGAIETLSGLLGDLGNGLAQAIVETAQPAPHASASVGSVPGLSGVRLQKRNVRPAATMWTSSRLNPYSANPSQ